jgi:glutamyl-tRNA reductase
VRLYNIDDLVAVADSNAELRKKEAAAAERIIGPKAAEIHAKFAMNGLASAFRDIRSEAEELRRRRLEDAMAGREVSDEDRRLIDSLTRSVVNSVLHRTISRLRDESVRQGLGQRT